MQRTPLACAPLAGPCAPRKQSRHARARRAGLTARIGQLAVEADYSEAKAAHDEEVAGLNDAIKGDQAALAQLAEDTR
jgi:hypothetical protein